MKRSCIAVILLLCLVVGFLPLRSSAKSQQLAIGSLSETVSWTMYDDGTLLLEGTGSVTRIYPWTIQNWFNNVNYTLMVKKIIVEEGITSLEDAAFIQFEKLERLEIPRSVTYIDNILGYRGCLKDIYYAGSRADWAQLHVRIYMDETLALPTVHFDHVHNGWVNDNDGWRYLVEDVPTSGWTAIDGRWYYMNTDGVMQTGWQQLSGDWYYLDTSGAMRTGWQPINGCWYYLNSSGVMQTGWQSIDGNWYYFDASGIMQSGWNFLGGRWYYLAESGIMQTGWQYIGGSWYYFYPGGNMASSTTLTLGGIRYTFDASGRWVA